MERVYFNPKDGRYNFENPSLFKTLPSQLRTRRHVMEIKEYSARRSNGANAYYWKIVIDYFMREMGLVDSEANKEYMHYDVLGRELRQIEDPNRPGETMTQRTRDMTGSEFWKYIYRCQMLFHDVYNGSFPPPKSLGYDTTKK